MDFSREARPLQFPGSGPAQVPQWLDAASHTAVIRPLFQRPGAAQPDRAADTPPPESANSAAAVALEARVADAVSRQVAALRQEAEAAGHAAGEAAGRAAGEAAGRDALQQEVARVAALTDELGQLRRQILADTEKQLVDLALTISRSVLERELADDGEYTRRMVHSAIQLVADGDEIEIQLSRQDLELLTPELSKLAENLPRVSSLQLRENPELSHGCIAETRLASVDATAMARLKNICDALTDEESAPIEELNR